jgi:hypothetical protein
MIWKNFIYMVLKNILLVVCDDKNRPSVKRVIALEMSLIASFVIIHTQLVYVKPGFTWDSTAMLLGVIFTFISSLVAAALIERKHILNAEKDQPKEEEKKPE